MVLIALIGIGLSIANKKNAAKAKQQKQASQGRDALGPKAAAPNRTSPQKPSAAPSKFPAAGSSKYPSASPSKRSSTAQKPQAKPAASAYGGTPRYTHVVQSTLEGGHTHTESSMTGEEACPPPKTVAQKQPETGSHAVDTGANALLNFQTNSVLQGVLYAEILGKPKALQRD